MSVDVECLCSGLRLSLTFVGLVCYLTLICEDAVGFERTFAVMIVIHF